MGPKSKSLALPEVQGDILKKAREARHMDISGLASLACVGKKHIQQLENGDDSIFFSPDHKIQVAKKVAHILGLDPVDVLVYQEPQAVESVNQHQTMLPLDDAPREAPVPFDPVVEKEPVSQTKVNLENLRAMAHAQDASSPFFERYGKAMISVALVAGVLGGLYLTKDEITQLVKGGPKVEVQDSAANTATNENTEGGQAKEVPASTVIPPLPSEAGCPSADAMIADYTTVDPTKPGNFVYVQAKTKQIICVVDASGKSSMQNLEAGATHTFSGKAPFVVTTSSLDQVNTYFQGKLIKPASPSARSIRLIEAKYN